MSYMIGQTRVSIIVPCKKIDNYAKECIEHCRQLDYGNYEIILLPDDAQEKIEGSYIITTGPITPGAKRNIGVESSSGEICAFIDSDAFPRKDWLNKAIKYFDDPQVAAIGGPGLTPEEDSDRQRASGYVLSSFMVGSMSSRYKAKRSSESDDIHSCNFIARRTILNEVCGWNEKYWPGEDTLLCSEIEKKGKKMVEDSDIVVYHHRKPLFIPHLKQMFSFGLHRGFFVKRFKGNSMKLTYILPSLLFVFISVGALISLVSRLIAYLFIGLLVAYLLFSLLMTFMETRDLKLLPLVFIGIVLTHITYGFAFLVGLIENDLRR